MIISNHFQIIYTSLRQHKPWNCSMSRRKILKTKPWPAAPWITNEGLPPLPTPESRLLLSPSQSEHERSIKFRSWCLLHDTLLSFPHASLACSRLRDSGARNNAERTWKKIARELRERTRRSRPFIARVRFVIFPFLLSAESLGQASITAVKRTRLSVPWKSVSV